MQPDPDYLRQHYALLSDEALLELDRTDLVDVAQKLYDAEVAHRNLAIVHDDPEPDDELNPPDDQESADYEPTPELDHEGEQPDWLEDASIAVAYHADSGKTEPPAAADAFDTLRTAGIPCFLDLHEVPQERQPPPTPGYEWRVMVPGKFSFRAGEVLRRDIYNADVEASWKAHLESLSDEELADSNPREDFCGLFDQIERVTRVYNQELARRRGTS
jgi:hypothetical protein